MYIEKLLNFEQLFLVHHRIVATVNLKIVFTFLPGQMNIYLHQH